MAAEKKWMIYGATGFTGQLIAAEAVRRGHAPVLAGRSESKLAALAVKMGVEWRSAELDDPDSLKRALEGMALVVHAAGPFVNTSRPMIEACLANQAHYIDITGEIPVFQQTFTYDRAAQEQKIALISGAGIDVVPTDCLAVYVARQLPGADTLELALSTLSQATPGTLKSALEIVPGGGLVRRAGKLVSLELGKGARRVRFSDRERWAVPFPSGDLETAYHSTGIPNITAYMAVPGKTIRLLERYSPILQSVLKVGLIRKLLQAVLGGFAHGPDEELRGRGKARIWAMASSSNGRQVEAWLETIEPYRFTAQAAVRAAEKLLAEPVTGALSPAQAFGADFVLEIEGTRRFDSLPAAEQKAPEKSVREI